MPPITSKYPFCVISSSWESKVWKEKHHHGSCGFEKLKVMR
jgi:hypothetical protein